MNKVSAKVVQATTLLLLLCGQSPAQQAVDAQETGTVVGAAEPPSSAPLPSGGLEQDPGFFPTFQDSLVLSGPEGRDPDYSRKTGSDLPHLAASGDFWSYETQPSPMRGFQRMLLPFNYIFQPFVSGWGYNLGQSETGFTSVDFTFSPMQGLTRDYQPEESHFAYLFGMDSTQYFPLYFDVLNVSALTAYGHGSGLPFSDGNDGWIAGLSTDIRFVLKLTDRTSLMVNTTLMLLWDEQDDFDFGFGNSWNNGFPLSPSVIANSLWQFELGEWDFTVYDMAGVISGWGLTFGGGLADEAYAQTIGYGIGIGEYRIADGDWFDSGNASFYNSAGIRAGTFIGRDWRLLLSFARHDVWDMDSWTHQPGLEDWRAGLYYNANDWWIAPSITWFSASRDFNFIQHGAAVGATAPLGPNLFAHGSVGYTFGEDMGEDLTWNLGARWLMTDRLTSWIEYTQGYNSPLVGSSWIGTGLGVGANWRIGPRTNLDYTALWGHASNTGVDNFTQTLGLRYAVGNYASLHCYVGDQEIANSPDDGRTIVWGIELMARLATRLTGSVGYRNTDINFSQDSNFGTAYLTLTRTF